MDQVVPVSAHAPCDVGHSQTCLQINSKWNEPLLDSENRPIAACAIYSGWKATRDSAGDAQPARTYPPHKPFMPIKHNSCGDSRNCVSH